MLKHNGYKTDGEDSFLPGAEAFLRSLPEKDMVVFLTSREEGYREQTLRFLDAHGIRYAAVVFGVPYGERILVNDRKPSGLVTALAADVERDGPFPVRFREEAGR